jgi:hypothetical protein
MTVNFASSKPQEHRICCVVVGTLPNRLEKDFWKTEEIVFYSEVPGAVKPKLGNGTGAWNLQSRVFSREIWGFRAEVCARCTFFSGDKVCRALSSLSCSPADFPPDRVRAQGTKLAGHTGAQGSLSFFLVFISSRSQFPKCIKPRFAAFRRLLQATSLISAADDPRIHPHNLHSLRPKL